MFPSVYTLLSACYSLFRCVFSVLNDTRAILFVVALYISRFHMLANYCLILQICGTILAGINVNFLASSLNLKIPNLRRADNNFCSWVLHRMPISRWPRSRWPLAIDVSNTLLKGSIEEQMNILFSRLRLKDFGELDKGQIGMRTWSEHLQSGSSWRVFPCRLQQSSEYVKVV